MAETLLLEGPDAVAFAQSQFSSNVMLLASSQWQFGAWLDAQGRVRALFHLARMGDESLLMLLRGGEAAAIGDALRRFVFRSKVSITTSPARGLSTGPALQLHRFEMQQQTAVFGCGNHSVRLAPAAVPGDRHWRKLQLREGWPWLPPAALDALLPSALSLHRLQAAALDKGCYPGQEIVARMHYRGGGKRHLHSAALSAHLDAGTPLFSARREVGMVLDALTSDEGIEGLVVLADDVVEHIEMLDGMPIIEMRSAWPA